MFIKQSVFEKQIKNAYKYHALRVYKSPHNDLIIGTTGWTLAIYKDFISKEVKGALVKLVGDLPEQTRSILYGEGADMQYEMETTIDTSILDNNYLEDGDYSQFFVSNLTIEKKFRVIQSESDNSTIRMYKQEHLDMIVRNLVDIKAGEIRVEGPVSSDEGLSLRWYTNAGVLEIRLAVSEDFTNNLLDVLRTVKLERYEE